MMKYKYYNNNVAILTFSILSVMFLIMFGYYGVGRSGQFAFDMPYLQVAGEMWRNLANPYDVESFKENMKLVTGLDSGNYAYPPNSFPIALALSFGSSDTARWISGAMNLAAIGFLTLFIHWGAAAGEYIRTSHARATAVIASALVIGNPLTAHVVWMGQTTLISAAFIYGCWMLANRRLDLLAGILLGISAFKPQLAILVGLWFLLDRRWVLVAAAAVTTIVVSGWPIVAQGVDGSWLAWMRTLSQYQNTVHNLPSFKHVFGLRSVLATAGISAPSFMVPGIIALIALYRFRRHYEEIWLINAILIISFLFVYSHDYDLAPVAVIAFPLLMAAQGRPRVLMLLCFLAFVIFFPQRIWERFDLDMMARTRELALMGVLATYLKICRITWPAASKAAVAV